MNPDKPLPEGLHPDTLAVRVGIDASAYGENSEALYLTSCFVQPDAVTSARRFAGEDTCFAGSHHADDDGAGACGHNLRILSTIGEYSC